MKIIFLGIDGVLAPFGRRNPAIIDVEAAAHLRRIVAATGALVVLASSWPEDDARALLEPFGVELHAALGDARRTFAGRPREIRKYIRRHKVTRWVWIDDDLTPRGYILRSYTGRRTAPDAPRYPYPLDLRRNLRTDWSVTWNGEVSGAGLTSAVADQATRILLEPFPIDDEIARAYSAWRTAEAAFEELFPPVAASDCCKSCRYGAPYAAGVAILERKVRWLLVLLQKRGTSDDIKLAEALRWELSNPLASTSDPG